MSHETIEKHVNDLLGLACELTSECIKNSSQGYLSLLDRPSYFIPIDGVVQGSNG